MRLLKEVRTLTGNYHAKSGMYHYHRNEFKQAVEFLRKALKDDDLSAADRRNTRYYLTLALMDWSDKLQAGGDLEGGVAQLRDAAEVSPTYPDLHYRAAQLLEQLGRTEEALAAYEQALACQQDYLEARVAMGFCLLRAGRIDAACEVFRKALALKQERVQRPFDRGLELARRGDTADAAEMFQESLLASPELCEEHLRKAQSLLKVEEYEKALAELDRALAIKPKYPDLHNFRGVALCELDRLEEAIAAFRASAALSPHFIVPRLNLAFALIRAGEYKKAGDELESILELDPSEPAAAAKLEELRSGRLPEKRRPVARGSSR